MIAQIKFAPAGLLLLLALAAPQDAALAATGPFAALAGSWSGGGTLTMSNGAQERLRCRASYNPAGGGDSLHLTLRCASDSYKFDVASDVVNRGGAISGSWNEASHNASGSVSGRRERRQHSGDRTRRELLHGSVAHHQRQPAIRHAHAPGNRRAGCLGDARQAVRN